MFMSMTFHLPTVFMLVFFILPGISSEESAASKAALQEKVNQLKKELDALTSLVVQCKKLTFITIATLRQSV